MLTETISCCRIAACCWLSSSTRRSRPPITQMPCEFSLELTPGRHVALDTVCSSDALDMSRAEDGTLVAGQFWGCLKITHDLSASPSPGVHEMSFNGKRLDPNATPHRPLPSNNQSMLTDGPTLTTARPATLRSSIKIKALKDAYFDLAVGCSPMWRMTGSWPPAEEVGEFKSKWFVRASPGGVVEHFKSGVVVNELFYEATCVPPYALSRPDFFEGLIRPDILR